MRTSFDLDKEEFELIYRIAHIDANFEGEYATILFSDCQSFKFLDSSKKTYVEFLNDVRLRYACDRLKSTDSPITDICYESGFNNWSNFSVQFKKRYHMSPKDYRKQWK